jgi:hypothetical protein
MSSAAFEPARHAMGDTLRVDDRRTVPGAATTVERSSATGFSPPPELSGPAVLYLKVGPGT